MGGEVWAFLVQRGGGRIDGLVFGFHIPSVEWLTVSLKMVIVGVSTSCSYILVPFHIVSPSNFYHHQISFQCINLQLIADQAWC